MPNLAFKVENVYVSQRQTHKATTLSNLRTHAWEYFIPSPILGYLHSLK